MDQLKVTRRAGLRTIMGAAAAAAVGGIGAGHPHASAQSAGRTIRYVVPYPAGGGNDFLARTVASSIAGETIVVDNKPGANGSIGVADMLRSPKDGLTWINVDNGILVFNPVLYSKLGYSPADLRIVTLIGQSPMLLAKGPGADFNTPAELFAKLKASPRTMNYGSAGAGGAQHMAMEMLLKQLGTSAVHVPYRGSAPALQDLMAGVFPVMFTDFPASRAFIQSGKVKPLAVAGTARLAQLPDVPTLAELGVRDAELYSWVGVAVAAGTPEDAVAAAHRRLRASLSSAPVMEKLQGGVSSFSVQ